MRKSLFKFLKETKNKSIYVIFYICVRLHGDVTSVHSCDSAHDTLSCLGSFLRQEPSWRFVNQPEGKLQFNGSKEIRLLKLYHILGY